ncbi:MAG: DNA mismatch repair protein MutS [Chloracidobacterium sp.]|nr:DNA mismatch repair protein MutS [Chloracidobacterium sp.]
MTDPREEYIRRLAARRAALNHEQQKSRKIWFWRRVVFAVIALMIILPLEKVVAWWYVAPPVVVFIALMVIHQRVSAAVARSERAVKYYERAIGRLEDNWSGAGEKGDRFAERSHPYSEDLDLFGEGSMFELLSTARTKAGEERLASWLLAPAPIPEIMARQQSVDELRSRLDLREDVALLGDEVSAGAHPEELVAWAGNEQVFTARETRYLQIAALLIGLFSAAAVVMWLGFGYRKTAMVALMIEASFLFLYRSQIGRVVAEVERPGRELSLLAEILGRLEEERFTAPTLARLRSELDSDGKPPSRQIARLGRLIQILDSLKNQFFAPIAFVLLIPAQLALAIERWRQRAGAKIPQWLNAVAEIEALSSLAGYAYEHPRDPFPELVESEVLFEGESLAHPLIPESRSVRNDVLLGAAQRALIVSGSNMSGKSTLMRTVGTNVVLALAGAPVRATRLRLSPLAIGASIHILDSLQTGASRFYAEITRLRQIVELTKSALPLLFLLDEILSGTNSHDRLIGAEAVVRGLVERGAIGIVTTHDLALTRIAESLNHRAANVHFEDHLENGRMIFDYKMQPGVVRRSNALELMRSVGLEV